MSCTKKINTPTLNTSCISQDAIASNIDCALDYEPVCGCNEATYRNVCFAKAAGVKKWDKGICPGMCIDPTIVVKDQICYRELAPVCGCDGNTYTNVCYAQKKGILSFTEGECGSSDVK